MSMIKRVLVAIALFGLPYLAACILVAANAGWRL